MAGSKRLDSAQRAVSEGFTYEDKTEEEKWTTACFCLPVKMHTVETFRFEGDVRFLKGCYIVVGLMNKRTGIPKEVISSMSLANHEAHWSVFPEIKAAIQQLQPWWKRALSLKSVGAFSIYQCYPDHGYHDACNIVDESGRPGHGGILASFFTDYTHWAANPGKFDPRTEEISCSWGKWVRLNFNSVDFEETQPGQKPSPYQSLELVLRWSPLKIAVYGLSPILLSLLVGFWYQFSHEGDPVAIAQAAWGISSSILAASGCMAPKTQASKQTVANLITRSGSCRSGGYNAARCYLREEVLLNNSRSSNAADETCFYFLDKE
jgi:hypothetical protein